MSKGDEEDVSTMIVPGLRADAMPLEPSKTARTMPPWGSMVIMTEQSLNAEGEEPEVVFCHSETARWTLDWSWSWTTRW